MPHISKQKLSKSVLEKLSKQLMGILSSKKQADTERVLSALLTNTEKIMLAKRLATILLLSEGVSLYSISQNLKMSTSTVQRMKQAYDEGVYADLLVVVKQRTHDREQFLLLIGKIARLGMPEMGKNRWQFLP